MSRVDPELLPNCSPELLPPNCSIKPIGPGVLATAYLDTMQRSVRSLRSAAGPVYRTAAKWWRDAGEEAYCPVIGHMFPAHFQDKRAPQRITFLAGREDQALKQPPGKGAFVMYLGYQKTPSAMIEQAVAQGYNLLYVAVTPATPAAPAANVIYLNPYWPLPDGCIDVPGYDVPILPASGVMSAAIYWSLLADVCETTQQ